MNLNDERIMRESLMHALAEEFAAQPVLDRDFLAKVDYGWGPKRVIDINKGIWNPREFAATLTIVSDPRGNYDDGDHGDSLYRYSYEKQPPGMDPRGGSNKKLREAMRLKLPIIMLRKVAPGRFVPVMPVYVVAEQPEHKRFLLALDESLRFLPNPDHLSDDERRYAQRIVQQRLHQPEFRSRVLIAYENTCAVCTLKKPPLLDAAHITPDSDARGLPKVTNGLSLCKIHHAAYDQNILGISPDYTVKINSEILTEIDGPMLKHGIQEMNQRQLWVPRSAKEQPDRDRLATRYEQFLTA